MDEQVLCLPHMRPLLRSALSAAHRYHPIGPAVSRPPLGVFGPGTHMPLGGMYTRELGVEPDLLDLGLWTAHTSPFVVVFDFYIRFGV